MKQLITVLFVLFSCLVFAQTKLGRQPLIIKGGNNQIGNYNIQNNYQDPNYIPDSINVIFGYIDTNEIAFAIMPKRGGWAQPFVIYPDTFMQKLKGYEHVSIIGDCSGLRYAGMASGVESIVTYKGKKFSCGGIILNTVCSKNTPLCINLKNKDCFVIFGDYADDSKWYMYDFGNVCWVKSNGNIQSISYR